MELDLKRIDSYLQLMVTEVAGLEKNPCPFGRSDRFRPGKDEKPQYWRVQDEAFLKNLRAGLTDFHEFAEPIRQDLKKS